MRYSCFWLLQRISSCLISVDVPSKLVIKDNTEIFVRDIIFIFSSIIHFTHLNGIYIYMSLNNADNFPNDGNSSPPSINIVQRHINLRYQAKL